MNISNLWVMQKQLSKQAPFCNCLVRWAAHTPQKLGQKQLIPCCVKAQCNTLYKLNCLICIVPAQNPNKTVQTYTFI